MYDSIIKQLNPIPKFNIEWYEGSDKYSEGDVEDEIIKMIADSTPEDYVDVIYDHFSWSSYYHLSHIRQNILNWYPFDENSNLLEIGCGMGAITGMLCDRVGSVTAVEMSKRRATATLLRCREKSNLEIIVGNLNDIEFGRKFDYITLIGVLEYQGNYTSSPNPYLDFLNKIKTLLKPTGKLLIAIENQFGLKYWCGAFEDHTGVPFDGINLYNLSNSKNRTFSRKELEKLINKAGFGSTYFYYPMPDYKLPTVIYSQDKKPENGNMQNMQPYYVPNTETVIADEKKLWNKIVDNDVFEFFANSFLVECRINDIKEADETNSRITFASMSTARFPEYRIGTRFISDKYVEKFLLTDRGRHIDTIIKNEINLEKAGLNILKGEKRGNSIYYKYVDKELLENKILGLIRDGQVENALGMFDKVYDEIVRSSDEALPEDNLFVTFGLDAPTDLSVYGKILKIGYVDMILRNSFVEENNELIWFDQEWTLENIPAGYVMYRLIKEFWSSFNEVNDVVDINTMASRYNLTRVWHLYNEIETLFMGSIIDKKHLAESAVYTRKI